MSESIDPSQAEPPADDVGVADPEADEAPEAGHQPAQLRTAQPRTAQVYDFRRPARVSKDRKRSLEAIYALFVKTFEGWLAGRTRAPIHMTLRGLDQRTFGEFQSSLGSPCSAYSFEVHQSPAQNAVVAFGSDLSYYLLDRLLGGPGHGIGLDDRALTVMERQVLKIVASRAAGQLGEVWQEYAELEFTPAGFESIPDMLRAASREEPYLIANMGVAAGSVECSLLVALPFACLDTFFASDVRRESHADDPSPTRIADRRAAEGTLRTTALDVSVRLPRFTVPLETILALQPGQLLTTPHFGDTPVDIVVGGQTRYRGRAGRTGMRLAAEVQEVLAEDPEKDRRTRAGS